MTVEGRKLLGFFFFRGFFLVAGGLRFRLWLRFGDGLLLLCRLFGHVGGHFGLDRLGGSLTGLDQLEDHLAGGIADAVCSEPKDSGVSTVAVRVTRGDLIEEVSHGSFVRKDLEGAAPCCERTFFAKGNQPLGETTGFFGLGGRGLAVPTPFAAFRGCRYRAGSGSPNRGQQYGAYQGHFGRAL